MIDVKFYPKERTISLHYLDYAATTPVVEEVKKAIFDEMAYFGNPSSVYQIGRTQKQKIQAVKKDILQELHAATNDSIIFTGSGSEANNLVFESICQHFANEKGEIIISGIEHPSVKKAAAYAEQLGFTIIALVPDETGCISVKQVEEALTEKTRLVSIMTVNNETGAYQPIHEIGELLVEHPAYFHTDAVQAFAQEEMDVTTSHIDYLSSSGHKIHAPKGIGFLYKKKEAPIHALIKGGGQEQGWRAGTENVPYIVGFQKALALAIQTRNDKKNRYIELSEYLQEQLTARQIPFEINGDVFKKSPHICNVWLKGIPASQTLIMCDLHQVAVSAGSACSAGSLEPSPVLSLMYPQNKNRVVESVRLSFGGETTKEDIDAFISSISSIKRP